MAANDDAEQSTSGTMYLSNSKITLVRTSNNRTIGLRFTGVNIPQGALISEAQLQFTVDTTTTEATSLTIQAQASDNAPAFTSTSNNISSRVKTTAAVTWTPAEWNVRELSGPDQRTPDLAPVLQEVIDRPGWDSGNALAIIITGTGQRIADAYEDNVYDAAYLHVEYTLTPPISPFEGATLSLTPNLAGPNITGTTQDLAATLMDSSGEPMANVSIQFAISGPNASNNTTTTNASGIASFTYTGVNDGTDSIQAVASSDNFQLASNISTIHWVTPVQTVSTTTVWGRFFATDGHGVFNTQASQPSVFDQAFPTINFNPPDASYYPPDGTVPGNTSGVNVATRPFTNITTDLNGNFTGVIVAQGNGLQAGVGTLTDFSAVFTSELLVADPGDITFNFFSDDGFIFSVGNNATAVSGPMVGAPASGLSPFMNIPVMGANNQATRPDPVAITVHFPTAGTYPYELDYAEGLGGALSLNMTTAASGSHGVPPTNMLTITPGVVSSLPTGQQQTFSVDLADASGLAVPNSTVVVYVDGPNQQQLNATTDSLGQATFSYMGSNTGTDSVQAIAWVNGKMIFSSAVSVPWTQGAPPSSDGPLAIPGWIGSPAQQATVSGVVPITLANGVTLQSGTLDYWPVGNPDQITVLGTVSNVNGGGMLASLDTTTLANGSYVIRLQGTNSNNVQQDSGIMITVAGEYKPGRVRFTITDLTIPVAGLPITIARTYDSLERDQVGDFGNGWSLAIGNPKLEADFAHNVTLTMPDGKRSTFYFTPIPYPQEFGFFLKPHYTPEAGVYGTLEAPDCLVVSSGGKYFCFLESGEYSPVQYTYTDPYGRKFLMDANGTLKTITDLNNNVLTFSPTGISSSAGNIDVPFVRDTQGRITQITYPVGKNYIYEYKDASDVDTGDLQTVTFPTVTQPTQQTIVLKYSYYADHFFKDATDPRNKKPVTTTYDSANRVQSVTDAMGNKTTYDYDLSTHTTTVHYLGDPTISTDDLGDASLTYDAAGYLTNYIDPLGNETIYTYDPANHNLIKVRDPLLHEVQYTYNPDGHPTSIIDPLTKTLGTVDYNQYGGPTTLSTIQGGNAMVTYDPVTFMPMSASDDLGSLGSYTWTSQGNPDTFTNQYGETTRYKYTDEGYLEYQIDPLEHVVRLR